MRRSLGKFSNPTVGNATKHTLITSSSSSPSAFSTSAGGGGGRGRGRGSSLSGPPDFQLGKSEPGDDDPKGETPSPFPSGLGHGRGKPLPSSPILPSFSSFVSAVSSSSSTGRGRAPAPPPPPQSEPEHFGPKRPIFFSKEGVTDSTTPKTQIGDSGRNPQDSNLPSDILSVLSGVGRGKPVKQSLPDEKAKEENRHLRSRQPGQRRAVGVVSVEGSSTPKLSREEAVKKAVGILSRGGSFGDRVEEGGRGRGGFRGRGTRDGRGRGRSRGRRREGRGQDADDDYGAGLYLGDNADGEKLAERIGAENMNKLVEAFEEMSGRVLPSPVDDAYLDGVHTNFMVKHIVMLIS